MPELPKKHRIGFPIAINSPFALRGVRALSSAIQALNTKGIFPVAQGKSAERNFGMKSTKVLFTNFWGDEVTKRQYVDEKIRVLSEMLIFSPRSVLKREERSEYLKELKRTIRKILMSCDTEIQIDALSRVLIMGNVSPDEFVQVHSAKIKNR